MNQVKKQHGREVKKIFLLNHIISELSDGKMPSKIAFELGESKQNIGYYIRQLKKKGIIQKLGYGVWKVNKEVKISTKDTIPLEVKNVRGHAFIWKVKIPNPPDWWKMSVKKKVLKAKGIEFKEVGIRATPRIIINGRKIWLGNKYITIYEPKGSSFFAEDSINSRKLAVYTLLETLREIEEKIRYRQYALKLKPYTFMPSREHYALIKNILAIQCNKEGEKISVFDHNGRWLMIDDSLGEGGELENEGKESLTTNKKMQKWWNDNKKHDFEVTPTFILKGFKENSDSVKKLIDAQKGIPPLLNQWGKQLEQYHEENKSHLALIKAYRSENIAYRAEVKKKYKLKSDQKTLSDFK